MEKLKDVINKLEALASKLDMANESVSKVPVAWHIEHSLLTIEMIIYQLKRSDPSAFKSKFSFPKFFVFTFGKIPRGKAQSPRPVQPKGNITLESLKTHCILAIDKVNELAGMKSNSHFEHPIFGKLNLKSTKRFLEIHTNHHLAIINDIIKH